MQGQTLNVWVEKRLHVLTQLFHGIVTETNKNKRTSQYLPSTGNFTISETCR